MNTALHPTLIDALIRNGNKDDLVGLTRNKALSHEQLVQLAEKNVPKVMFNLASKPQFTSEEIDKYFVPLIATKDFNIIYSIILNPNTSEKTILKIANASYLRDIQLWLFCFRVLAGDDELLVLQSSDEAYFALKEIMYLKVIATFQAVQQMMEQQGYLFDKGFQIPSFPPYSKIEQRLYAYMNGQLKEIVGDESVNYPSEWVEVYHQAVLGNIFKKHGLSLNVEENI